MSAFIVNEQHIALLVHKAIQHELTWWHGGSYHVARPGSGDRLGAMLWRENHDSVNYRYRENETPPRYVHRPTSDTVLAPSLAVVKAIACYQYQSCEHPQWEASEARAFTDALLRNLIPDLDGYDAMPDEWTGVLPTAAEAK